MNRTEIVKLCRAVKALCPSQAIDTYTPDAWALVLDHTDYADAEQAVKTLAGLPLEPGKSRYIEPGHIIGEVGRIRAKRLEATEMPSPPAGLDAAGYQDWHRATREAIASGTYTPAQVAVAASAATFDWRAAMPALAAYAGTPAKTPEQRTVISDGDAERERVRQMQALEKRIAGAES